MKSVKEICSNLLKEGQIKRGLGQPKNKTFKHAWGKKITLLGRAKMETIQNLYIIDGNMNLRLQV